PVAHARGILPSGPTACGSRDIMPGPFSRGFYPRAKAGRGYVRMAMVIERAGRLHGRPFGLRERALAASALAAACGNSNRAAPPRGPATVSVKMEGARASASEASTEYVALIKSPASSVGMPRGEGRSTRICRRSGERVAPGTPLMGIDALK